MQDKSFEQAFNIELFKKSRFMVDECIGQNCDFFIFELVKHFEYSVFQCNDSGDSIKNILKAKNTTGTVNSAYYQEYRNEDIIDDVYVGRRIYKPNIVTYSKVDVFRSGTASKKDYYDYDFVVKIEKLQSGCSNRIDGTIAIQKRNEILKEAKYKIFPDKILYYD